MKKEEIIQTLLSELGMDNDMYNRLRVAHIWNCAIDAAAENAIATVEDYFGSPTASVDLDSITDLKFKTNEK